ncbi:conserved hypothetical protein [Paenibacillus curdlanolyticus YK9]|uniref:Transcription factor zinc-finger domain-containing protein n=1 Tax=Paenibacillus curdlanolyticus YK9 TaxID=717606 RepID=E0IGC8_9BACL|nr:conserved hypothetical protein [Paenibacillus curdlanolyticus YK9]
MKCPVCADVRMREIEKDGVLIDVCPDCKGVWLDRGELDKLMQGVKELRGDVDAYYSGTPAQQQPNNSYGSQSGGAAPGSYRAQQQNNASGQQSSGGYNSSPSTGGYGSQPQSQQGSYGQHAGGYGSHAQGQYGYGQQGASQHNQGHQSFGQQGYGQQGYGQQGYGQHGYGKHGHHNSHGYPHKKKKTVLDVLGDLFD